MATIKFDNQLQEDIYNYMMSMDGFHYNGYTGTIWFRTWTKEDGDYDGRVLSKKPIGYDLEQCRFEIMIYALRYKEHEKHGVEFEINCKLPKEMEQERLFLGWAESLDDFKVILKSVGL